MKYFLLVFVFIISSCNNSDNTFKKPLRSFNEIQKGCYFLSIGRDSLLIQIIETDDTIRGKMVFDNFEKDGSRGIIRGTMHGDTLKGWYDFESEGMRSVMEIMFLNEDSFLIRAQGKVDVKADTVYFPDPSVISFPDENAYRRVSCDNHPVLGKF